jgi:hypothetical protein
MIKDINDFFCLSEHEDIIVVDKVVEKPKPVCTINPSGLSYSLGDIRPYVNEYIHVIKKKVIKYIYENNSILGFSASTVRFMNGFGSSNWIFIQKFFEILI